MSFDVFLQRFRAGDKAEADRAAVLAVLKRHKHFGPDKFGFYRLTFPDGGEAEFSARELEGGGQFHSCAFHLHGMSPDVCAFIFSVADAGNMVVLPAMRDFVPILVSSAQLRELPRSLSEEFPSPPVCSSGEDLRVLLEKGYAAWLQYRDRATGRR